MRILSLDNIDQLPLPGTDEIRLSLGETDNVFRKTLGLLDQMRTAKVLLDDPLRIALDNARMWTAMVLDRLHTLFRQGWSRYETRAEANVEDLVDLYLAELDVAKRAWNGWIESVQQDDAYAGLGQVSIATDDRGALMRVLGLGALTAGLVYLLR